MGAIINSGIGAYEATSKGVKSSFDVFHKGVPIFERFFNGESESVVDIENNRIAIPNHFFVSGEEIEYNFDFDFLHQPIGISTTNIVGIGTTDILPIKLYVIKEDNLYIKFADTPEKATIDPPIPIELRSVGIGTLHKIFAKETDSRVLLSVDNVIQSPLVGSGITAVLTSNVNIITDIIGVSTTKNLFNGDLIKLNDEIMEIRTVGFIAPSNLLVRRPVVGSKLGIHTEGDILEKLSGNYTIEANTLHFTSAPFGVGPNNEELFDESFDEEFDFRTSSNFSGRCFIRSSNPGDTNKAYYDNYIFDDISEEFTGFSSDFSLKSNKSDVENFNLDSMILLVRDIFQSPKVVSNISNEGNYEITTGISSISLNFTGLVDFPSEDVNRSGVPIGGVISSVGSFEGFGYQPLRSASLSPTLTLSGTIQSIEVNEGGSGYRPKVQSPINVYAKTGNFENQEIIKVGEAIVGDDIETRGKIVSVTLTNFGSGFFSDNIPEILIDAPLNYESIPLVYSSSSQSGIGTGAKIDVVVGQGSSVISYEIREYGYGYKTGDILTLPLGDDNGGLEGLTNFDFQIISENQIINPGITTTFEGPAVVDDNILIFVDDDAVLIIGDNNYISAVNEFQIFVDSVYKDKFSAWSFGELEVFDSPENLFNGIRKTFPLRINGVQKSIIGDATTDLQAALIIFVNGILQIPGESYIFEGGSSITFIDAPQGNLEGTEETGDTCKILFYRGTKDIDVVDVDILETIKRGDDVRLVGTENILKQNSRLVHEIIGTRNLLTNIYADQGVVSDPSLQRSLYWARQKDDIFIDGIEVTKDRPLYEPKIFPSTNIIQDVGIAATTSIYVESVKASFDNYREDITGKIFSSIEIIDQSEKNRAKATSTISTNGQVDAIIIQNGGSGYSENSLPTIIISNPIGIGSIGQAKAIATVLDGKISSIDVINPGFGYNLPPDIFIEHPATITERIDNVTYTGDYGVITGISTTIIGIGSTGLIFNLYVPDNSPIRDSSITGIAITSSQLNQGDFFVLRDTYVGEGITSIDLDGNVIGVGTEYIDNIYQVYSVEYDSKIFEDTDTISGFQIFNSPGIIQDEVTITVDDDAILVIDQFSTTNVTVRVSEFYPSIMSLSPSSFYGNYSWGKIQTTRRRSPKQFKSFYENGISGITSSSYVKRLNPLNYFDYIS
jgi:hypothetical protein